MLQIPCVILCGGKSSRMGENKALLPFGGFKTLVEFQQAKLLKIFTNVYINAKDRSLLDFTCNFIEDAKNDIFSPALGLLSILQTLNSSVFVLSVDTPFVDESIIKKLFLASKDGQKTAIAKSPRGLHPLCAIYTKDAVEPLKEMLLQNRHKLQILIEQIPHEIVEFENDEPFFNLNNKEEYKKALEMIESM
ncbi:MAG: molybdenum cofactor guanylyltransferase MobA [Campylobacteraceae bacterium]